ncbi:glycoside hydrolase [Hahella aquimaris]|uniref:glycoside hydrolase n=1 Tax=Hahella sp. HNIBRBA332 TaxID=3015983 RepID=UPI00273CDDCB|nr:glycoside hydrolase [Hahella sp. HNIBRBA332]WLQ14496.1 glycoside hydrolase [Hahella sp. HNIBRBA332]
MKRISVLAALLSMALQPTWAASVNVQLVQVTVGDDLYLIDPATLAVTVQVNQTQSPASAAAFAADDVKNVVFVEGDQRHWRIALADNAFDVKVAVDHGALTFAISADKPKTQIDWPMSVARQVSAYGLPLGEGFYIPADDAAWADWLQEKYDESALTELLSMPFWTEVRAGGNGQAGYSLTWTLENPFNTAMTFDRDEGALRLGVSHEFSPLMPDRPYVVRVRTGVATPVAGALAYRELLERQGLLTLDDKLAQNPNVAKLAGAPHIYLWSSGLIKPEDIKSWRPFVREFAAKYQTQGHLAQKLWAQCDKEARKMFTQAFKEAKGDVGFVSNYSRDAIVRAVNEALIKAIDAPAQHPLPGGHDPAMEVLRGDAMRTAMQQAFGAMMTQLESWGGGFSTDTIAALRKAGLTSAWLGANDWLDALWHPQSVNEAKAAGYLVGAYDSYGSIHAPDEPRTWLTAQVGRENWEKAPYRREDGSIVSGFSSVGAYANPLAIEEYAEQRMTAVTREAKLNSLFLDVDATGMIYEDYTEGRKTNEAQDVAARMQRLNFPREKLALVTGSEGGSALFANAIEFAHGMTITPFSWTDPDTGKNRQSTYYRGNYWPPEAPSLFFATKPIKPALRNIYYNPAYRLPLYQLALHDSVVATLHWEYSSLKFKETRVDVGLLQLLYMIPPMYHLNAANLKRDLPVIAAYDKVFRPWHEKLYSTRMTGFEFLSQDRLLQSTRFADGTTITANFSSQERKTGQSALPAQTVAIVAPDGVRSLIPLREMLQ